MANESEQYPRLEPHIPLAGVNEPLPLWSGVASTDWGAGLEECPSLLRYSWADQAIAFEVTYPHKQTSVMCARDVVSTDGTRFKAGWRGSYGLEGGTTIKGFAWDIHQIGDDDTDLKAVQFLLPNMQADFATQSVRFEPKPGNEKTVQRLVLESDDWRVIIDGLPDAQALHEELANARGWAVTRVGRVERMTGDTFRAASAGNLLAGLGLFFSFLRGQRVAPMLPIGFDATNSIVWRSVKPVQVERWGQGATWQREPGKVARSAFPGFLKLFLRTDRRTSVSLAIEWFLQSNSQDRGIDASIVSAFTGLDLMAWNLLVDDWQLISAQGFEKLDAADRLRLLLKTLQISFEVPVEYPELKAFVTGEFSDTLALIRNSLVHPTLKNRNKLSSLSAAGKRQAWLLATRIFELAILLWWECDVATFDFTWHDWRAAPWYPQ